MSSKLSPDAKRLRVRLVLSLCILVNFIETDSKDNHHLTACPNSYIGNSVSSQYVLDD